mmetsp:Transcript_9239/g.20417  ORF Transcript_9239/g.20417 Transcript_9239/m.20417 type:complete len:209 (-) Transcript_9239:3252-3878(-)
MELHILQCAWLHRAHTFDQSAHQLGQPAGQGWGPIGRGECDRGPSRHWGCGGGDQIGYHCGQESSRRAAYTISHGSSGGGSSSSSGGSSGAISGSHPQPSERLRRPGHCCSPSQRVGRGHVGSAAGGLHYLPDEPETHPARLSAGCQKAFVKQQRQHHVDRSACPLPACRPSPCPSCRSACESRPVGAQARASTALGLSRVAGADDVR